MIQYYWYIVDWSMTFLTERVIRFVSGDNLYPL